MFFVSLKTVTLGMAEIFLLAALGFFLVRRKIISDDGLDALSRIVVVFTLPAFIFHQLAKDFSFALYPNWWIFPLLSLGITGAGFLLGVFLLKVNAGIAPKRESVSLVAFQNSGYLPLSLIATIVPEPERPVMFTYLFLFLIGFNLVIWSLGAWFLSRNKNRQAGLKIASIFSPPVIATFAAFFFIIIGLNKFIPQVILRPIKLLGDCTVPMAMIIVGGSLAQLVIRPAKNLGLIFNAVLGKLIILPLIFLPLVLSLKINRQVGLLIIMQAAMPSATTLVLINRLYGLKEEAINQGVFYSHLISILTIPLFLTLFWMFCP